MRQQPRMHQGCGGWEQLRPFAWEVGKVTGASSLCPRLGRLPRVCTTEIMWTNGNVRGPGTNAQAGPLGKRCLPAVAKPLPRGSPYFRAVHEPPCWSGSGRHPAVKTVSGGGRGWGRGLHHRQQGTLASSGPWWDAWAGPVCGPGAEEPLALWGSLLESDSSVCWGPMGFR